MVRSRDGELPAAAADGVYQRAPGGRLASGESAAAACAHRGIVYPRGVGAAGLRAAVARVVWD